MKLRIGTRGSKLALWQAYAVRDALSAAHGADLEVEIIEITTRGDRIVDRPLAAIGGKGLFVKEIEQGLLDGAFDIAVHSAKDLPAEMPPGLALGAVLPREDAHDALVSRHGHRLEELPPGAIVGTSSLRRRAMLLRLRPDLEVISLRGNVPTRVRKIHEGVDGLDAGVLAYAGLKRLGMTDAVTEVIPFDIMLPAIGQGVVAIQMRSEDPTVADALKQIHHEDSWIALEAERAALATLEGSCHIPAAGHAWIEGEEIVVEARVVSPDGTEFIGGKDRGPLAEARMIGHRMAQWLLGQGADAIIAAASAQTAAEFSPVLDGLPVIVTRSRDQASELSRLVRAAGGQAIEVSTIRIEPADPAPVADALGRIPEYDWIIFTSANGVRLAWEAAEEPPAFGSTQIAVVGAKTAEALRQHGTRADLTPGRTTSEGLLEAMLAAGASSGERVLFLGAAVTRGVLQKGLREAGLEVDEVTVYTTHPAHESRAAIEEGLERRPQGWITFASSSAVQSLLEIIEVERLAGWRIACIGPITANAARARGLEVDLVPEQASIEALVRAIAERA